MNQANKSIQIVLSAAIPSLTAPSSNDTQYLWDLLNPVARFILLNQTAVSNDQQFNVTSQLVQNLTISWAAIPAGVQTALLNEKTTAALVNLTFVQWGWSQAGDIYATVTLFSLIGTQGQQALPQIDALVAPLNFNTVLNTTVLTQSKPHRRPGDFILDTLSRIQQIAPFNQFRMKRGGDGHRRQPTPFDVIEKAQNRAVRVLRQNAAGNGLKKHQFDF